MPMLGLVKVSQMSGPDNEEGIFEILNTTKYHLLRPKSADSEAEQISN